MIMLDWLKDNALSGDIVVATKVNLMRNAEKTPFSHKIKEEEIAELIKRKATECFTGDGRDLRYSEINDMTWQQKNRLVEGQIIPRELCSKENTALIYSEDYSISVALLGEDHYNIQYIKAGFDPEECFSICRNMASLLNGSVKFAYSDRFGYLTASPMNVGTGMKVSVLMHLKGLAASNSMRNVEVSLTQSGFSIRNFYSDESKPYGDLYIVSNTRSLGVTEQDILENVRGTVGRLITQEKETRERLYKDNTLSIEDRVYRAYGILKNSRVIGSREAIQDLSMLGLGKSLGIIDCCSQSMIFRLMISVSSAMMAEIKGTEIERNVSRAEMIRNVLK
jgi:protein arginine kinase